MAHLQELLRQVGDVDAVAVQERRRARAGDRDAPAGVPQRVVHRDDRRPGAARGAQRRTQRAL